MLYLDCIVWEDKMVAIMSFNETYRAAFSVLSVQKWQGKKEDTPYYHKTNILNVKPYTQYLFISSEL